MAIIDRSLIYSEITNSETERSLARAVDVPSESTSESVGESDLTLIAGTLIDAGILGVLGSVGTILPGVITPTSSEEFNLGSPDRPWGAVYSQLGVVQTSDMNAKRFISDSELGLSFVMALRPVSFTWRNESSTTPTFGFLGQQVEEALGGRGFGGLQHNEDIGYSLRYVDFIAPLTKAVQQQQEQIQSLKKELSQLRSMISRQG